MAKVWYLVKGNSPHEVKQAFRTIKRGGCQILGGIEGVSFYALLSDQEAGFRERLIREYKVTFTEVTSVPETKVLAGNGPSQGAENCKEISEKPMPSTEDLIKYATELSIKGLAQFYQVSDVTIQTWLKNLLEKGPVKGIYPCKECGEVYTGSSARWECASHIKYKHRNSLSRSKKKGRKPQPQAEVITADEALKQAIKIIHNRLGVHDKTIADLEEGKTQAIAKVTSEWNLKIAAAKTEKDKLANEILGSIT